MSTAQFPMKSSLGGRTRTSCGYHHQRHQACPGTCEGRKTHPLIPHPVVNDKFATGCQPCLTALYDQLQKEQTPNIQQSQAVTPLPSPNPNFNPIFKPITPPNSHNTSPNNTPGLNNSNNIMVDINSQPPDMLQFYIEKQRQIEAEENKVLTMNERLALLKEQQEKERTEIELHQRVIEYKRQQQALEVERIQKYQVELENAKRQQEMIRQRLLMESYILQEKVSLINRPSLNFPPALIPPPLTDIEKPNTTNKVAIGVMTVPSNNRFIEDYGMTGVETFDVRGKEKMSNDMSPFGSISVHTSKRPSPPRTSHTLKPLSVQYLVNMDDEGLDFDIQMGSSEERGAKSRRAAAASAMGKFYLPDRDDHDLDDDEDDY
eukprot:TRINITY_DN11760_c0_g1_i1.p1 TRINITY_DN11760_c0_g1~~TRINITY_DN11760_c0_g1_i1.p1  ORF type:complete len:376 (-),score=54.43 TRINITY_DN11760_c0_g1_i1:237-1364(-)